MTTNIEKNHALSCREESIWLNKPDNKQLELCHQQNTPKPREKRMTQYLKQLPFAVAWKSLSQGIIYSVFFSYKSLFRIFPLQFPVKHIERLFLKIKDSTSNSAWFLIQFVDKFLYIHVNFPLRIGKCLFSHHHLTILGDGRFI